MPTVSDFDNLSQIEAQDMTKTDKVARSTTASAARPLDAPPAGNATIVLREDEYGDDLGDAIAKLRADESTRAAQILIVRDDAGSELQGGPAVAGGSFESLFAREPSQIGRVAEVAPLSRLGDRLESLADCMNIFSEEIRSVVDEFDETASEAPRASLLASVRRVGEILSWSDEVVKELKIEATAAGNGWRPCSIAELLRDVLPVLELRYPGLRVQVDELVDTAEVTGRAADLAVVLGSALELTAARIGGQGVLRIAQSTASGRLITTIDGFGEPTEIERPAQVDRFRSLLAVYGGAVTPGAFGLGAAGIVLQLPLSGSADPEESSGHGAAASGTKRRGY